MVGLGRYSPALQGLPGGLASALSHPSGPVSQWPPMSVGLMHVSCFCLPWDPMYSMENLHSGPHLRDA